MKYQKNNKGFKKFLETVTYENHKEIFKERLI